MIWVPSTDFRYSMREGMVGTDVAALQLNLGKRVPVDGYFGPKTRRAVKRFQLFRPRLVMDGIAGPATQGAIAWRQMKEPAKTVPKGLLKSVASNESGFFLGSCGPHGKDEGWDVGVFARSTGPTQGSQSFLESCYDVKASAEWSAENLINKRNLLGSPVDSWYKTNIAGDNEQIFLWQLAVFSHNWPDGADNIARRGAITVDYVGDNNEDNKPAQWIIDVTKGRLQTPREWCLSYIQRATVYWHPSTKEN